MPEFSKFRRKTFGVSEVLKMPKSNISNGENIPGAAMMRAKY